MPASTPLRRLLALLALSAVPWTLILVDGGATLVSPLGFLDVPSGRAVDTYSLLAGGGGLPRSAELLPASLLLYLAALASGAVELAGDRAGRPVGDPRATGGLLALAALAHLGVSYAVVHRLQYTPLPVGVVLVLLVAWALYRPRAGMAPAGTGAGRRRN